MPFSSRIVARPRGRKQKCSTARPYTKFLIVPTYQTNDGRRVLSEGDLIVFLENHRDLRMKNGMLGTVSAIEADTIQVTLDGASRIGNDDRSVTIPVDRYQSFDDGYATTIHKIQGANVDWAFVLAPTTMDRHLTYVAMTRHLDAVRRYAVSAQFVGERSEQVSRADNREEWARSQRSAG